MNTTRRGQTHPARILATVNGEVASYPAGTKRLIGGWSESIDSNRAAEYVRGDIHDELVAALQETLAIATRNEEGEFADRARAALRKASEGDAP